MLDQIIIAIFAVVAVLAGLFLILKKPLGRYFNSLSERMIEKNLELVGEKSREIFKDERERLVERFDDKHNLIDEKMKKGEQYLDNTKDSVKEIVEKMVDEAVKTQNKIEVTEKERIGEFSNLKAILEEHKTVAHELKESTDNLKNILSNNQLRGKYGEEVAENLLKVAGFVKGLNYDGNLSQETNANRPDFTIYLPDKTKINIDAKFPYQSLVKYQEVNDELEKKKYFAQFRTDVKQKIKQVTSRDYINPEEKTLDFVILFVPNEMIFSIICDKLDDVVSEAYQKKVVISGPFTFTAILRMVHQSYDNFKIQNDLHRVVGLIGKFKQEFEKYNGEVDNLGKRIKLTVEQYDKVSGVRTRQLTKVVEQIEGEKVLEDKEKNKVLK